MPFGTLRIAKLVRHYAMFNKVFSIDNDKALVEKTLEELKSKPYFQQILDLDFNEGVIRGELYQSPLFDAFGPTPEREDFEPNAPIS